MTADTDLRRKAIDDLYAVFAPDVVLEAEVEAILARIVEIDCAAHEVAEPAERATRQVAAPESLREARYEGRIEAFDAIMVYLHTINGNGVDEPRDPALDAVWEKAHDLKARALAALRVDRESRPVPLRAVEHDHEHSGGGWRDHSPERHRHRPDGTVEWLG